MDRLAKTLTRIYCGILPLVGIIWVLNLHQLLGFSLVAAETIGGMLGLAVAASLLRYPYGAKAGWLDIVLGIMALGSWLWMSSHYTEWLLTMSERTVDKWLPGIVAIALMMEAMRKASGLAITVLTWALIAYGLLGHLLPGVLGAERTPVDRLTLYLYADSNGIPGLVLGLIISLVLAFVLLGKIMEVTGATRFFTELSMAWLGHRPGGPAKVAVVASSVFGTISGSTVGNIMSTGIVTIPLMRRFGFKEYQAAAIEAVASNGGQIAPPVMGATAFLIAEFLQIRYVDVVIAAAVPAALYYLVLFKQVEAMASRDGLAGMPREGLPRAREVLRNGWVFLLPIALLVYLLFWKGFNPALAALASAGVLPVLALVQKKKLPARAAWGKILHGTGESLLPLLLIGGGAGIIIGVLNFTGLGFSLSLILNELGHSYGLLSMLTVTALLSILLGMGMPTAAVYIVLSVVLAPALVEMGVSPLPAHLFIFYFGLLSMLTPPVAVASYVAASLAGADMWRTSLVAVQLAAMAYLLPFLWVFNPALLLEGEWRHILIVVVTAAVAGLILPRAVTAASAGGLLGWLRAIAHVLASLVVGSATLWAGRDSLLALAATLAALVSMRLTRAGPSC